MKFYLITSATLDLNTGNYQFKTEAFTGMIAGWYLKNNNEISDNESFLVNTVEISQEEYATLYKTLSQD